MAKFSLLTVLLLYLGMLYFGREAGLPDKRIGRETSLWAELFGGGGDAGPLALLTQPAAAPAPDLAPEPAPEPVQDLAPKPATEPASDIIAEPQEPAEALAVTDEAAVAVPGAAPDVAPGAGPETGPETGNEPEPEAEQIAGSDRAPARSLRPLARPERPVALAEADAAPTDAGSDAGSTDTGSTATGQTAAEPGPLEGALEQVLEDVLAEDDTPPVEGVPDTVDPESVATEAPDAASEPEADAVVATTFAPETTPRPLARPEPPAVQVVDVPVIDVPVIDVPVASVEPGTAPLAEIAPAPEALEEAPTSEVAALAAAALEEPPVAEPEAVILPEPVAEPAPEAAVAPESVETVAAVPEAPLATEPVAEEDAAAPEDVPALNETEAAPEAIAETEADTAAARELPSNLRPQPRPVQALAPVPAEELSQPAPEVLAAPEPEILPEILPETETGAEDGTSIVAAPLPEPKPVMPLFPDEPQGVLYVSSAGVTVHAGPSADDRAIDEMPRGSAVVDLGGDGDGWRMILLPNGAAGYIPDTEVSLTPNQ